MIMAPFLLCSTNTEAQMLLQVCVFNCFMIVVIVSQSPITESIYLAVLLCAYLSVLSYVKQITSLISGNNSSKQLLLDVCCSGFFHPQL